MHPKIQDCVQNSAENLIKLLIFIRAESNLSLLEKMSSHFCGNRTSNHVIIVILIKGARGSAFLKNIYIKSIFNWSKSIKVNFHQKFQFSLENYKKFWPNPEKVGKFWPFLTIFSKRSEILTKSEILTTMAAMPTVLPLINLIGLVCTVRTIFWGYGLLGLTRY